MGSHAVASVSKEERSEIIRLLISLYSFEMLAMHYNLAVQNRLQGQAFYLINDELGSKAELSRKHAKSLANRIALLGDAIPADPGSFLALSPLETYSLSANTSDIQEILTHTLQLVQAAIEAYDDLRRVVREKDDLTYMLVLDILEDHIESEDEIEAALMI